jgi:hypothetical protein
MILRGGISKPRQESTPHKVTMNHITERDRIYIAVGLSHESANNNLN